MHQHPPAEASSNGWGQPVDDELRLSDYLHILRRRWTWIAGVFAAVVALAVILTMLQNARYRAEAEVLVRNTTNESLFPAGPDVSSRIQREPTAELQYTASDAFVTAADEAAGFEADVDIEIKVIDPDERIPGASGVLVFTATADTAESAAAAADAYSNTYVGRRHTADIETVDQLVANATSAVEIADAERERVREPVDALNDRIANTTDTDTRTRLLAQLAQLESDLGAELSRVDIELNRAIDDLVDMEDLADLVADPASAARVNISAEVPDSPVSAGLTRNLALGIVVGAILGIGAALLRDSLDNTVHDVAVTQRRLGVPFLGALPELTSKSNGKFVTIRRRDAEAFRSIRTSLRFAGRDGAPLNVLGITSSAPDEGKTLCAVYLTSAMAIERDSVLLIDGDLRHRAVHRRTGLPNERGLTDILTGEATPDEVIQTFGSTRLDVITSGPVKPNPSELLGSDEFKQLIKQMSTQYEAIVVDTPPLLAVADPRLVGTAVDGMLLLLLADSTKLSEAERATALLHEANVHIGGFVLNRVSGRSSGYYGYEYAKAYTEKS